MRIWVRLIILLLLFIIIPVELLLPGTVKSEPPLNFNAIILDANNSGDCKALADIDGDGDLDPVLGGGDSLVWYENGADWASHIICAPPVYQEFSTDMQAGDIDNDGDADIIVGDGGGENNLIWFENPSINPPEGKTADVRNPENWIYHIIGSHGQWVHDIELGDIDNDGKIEVISSGHGYTHVWKQSDSTGWIDINLENAGKGIFIGDINRNGRPDIATPSGWFDTPADIENDNWQFFPVTTGNSNDEVLTMDVDGDSLLDIITIDAHNNSEFAWYKAPDDPTSSDWEKKIIDRSMASHKLEAADFNNDGRLDILAGKELSDLSIYYNLFDTAVTFYKQQIDTRAAHNARAGDLNNDGSIDIFGADYIGKPPAMIYINENIVSLKFENAQTAGYELCRNFPNPFNPSTEIRFRLPENSEISLKIFDILGSEVKTIFEGEKPAGEYSISWNGKNYSGKQVASGIYFCRLQSSKYVSTVKMLLLR